MRIKLTFLVSVITIFLMAGCGFKVVNQSGLIDFKIENISTSGDNRVSYIIKNKLLPYSKSNGKKLITLEIDLNRKKMIKEKNIKNETTKFEISISAVVQYRSDENGRFEISKKGDYNVASQYSQTLTNEKKLVKTLSESIAENIIEDTERSLFDLAERGSFSQSFLKFNQALDQTIEMATMAMQNDQGLVGVPTGLTDLDEKLGGLHKSDLVILAGRPSMGKTALATNIAYNAAQNILKRQEKSSVAFFSLEMSSEQLSTRILSEQAKIRSDDIRRGKVTEEEINRYIETSRNIYNLPLYIDETPAITIATLCNRARRIKRLFGLSLVVVDYIQLMRSSSNRNDGRVQEISEITQGLKALAKELSVPVLALSQLSRAVEQRDDKQPQLADLRESGSIEQDADVVMFVYRESYYLERKQPKLGSIEHAEWQSKMNDVNGLADIILGKQRHGPTGTIKVEFEGIYTKFKDLSKN